MQEEIENKSVTLIISGTKLTGRLLKAAITKYLAYLKETKQQKRIRSPDVKHYGKISMSELDKQFGDTKRVDLTEDAGLRRFDKIAREYHVHYAIRRNDMGQYQIFFKAPKAENMEAAFQKYAAEKLRDSQRPSVLEKLNKFKELLKDATPAKKRTQELER